MCNNFKERYWKSVKDEKDIRLRERKEEQTRWYTDLIFTIVLGGSLVLYFQLVSESKNILIIIFLAIATLICLLIGTFFAAKFLRDYYKVTDDYIVKKRRGEK